ncbi:hypothetical protein FC62_GL000955 [Amylolactobacillus amylotrophicus DSM 20534]|uniref:Uncharacterized protein n=3 Tax=Amylolactobacillus TaxID=2767876 RepID=A0A1L6XBM9_9LACO|nr:MULTISPECIES: hypothetical protein [Amylolactobacillus]APT18384.1 hypothetical protein LA20533_03460 [Amylolactobacillus amylophilus DSM 20533 = JCM 1125]KRK38177.1 hypothetical protein FC62_GL000955 [Amylolactobacillus amylotrophicus DSM 20534]KRM43189.1 hypothetical protein FD40_GL000198 [Amylolactobacillus amylophilus DSM 20533 = JCM 1125]GED80408.1 hypothetical protein LAM01_08810 [Amylolactobacillus amylophilus]
MAQRVTRSRRRLEQSENKKYKGFLAFSFFILISVGFFMATFMNPSYMERQVKKESNAVIVNTKLNDGFNTFAESLGADRASEQNLLTEEISEPIAQALIDYTLGFHWFKTDNQGLARRIQAILVERINDNSSTETKAIKKLINQNKRTAQYAIASGFNLTEVTALANAVTLAWLIGGLIVLLGLIMIFSVIHRLRGYLGAREIIHDLSGAMMWAAAFVIVLFGIVSLIPTFINPEQLFGLGFGLFLEVGSGVFLELVIVGAVFYVLSTIPWALSNTK